MKRSCESRVAHPLGEQASPTQSVFICVQLWFPFCFSIPTAGSRFNRRSATKGFCRIDPWAEAQYVFSVERMPLACCFRRLAENFVPHTLSCDARKFEQRESGPDASGDSARGPRALPGVPDGTLNTYGSSLPGSDASSNKS